MKKRILFLSTLLLGLGGAAHAQWAGTGASWVYNFTSGTSGTYSTTGTLNHSSDDPAFLPAPPSGTAMVFIASASDATFTLDATGNSLTMIPAASSSNKFAAYDIAEATAVASMSFGITLDSTDGSSIANNLAYVWSLGNSGAAGNVYNSKNSVYTASTAFQSIFTALRLLYSSANKRYALGYRASGSSSGSSYTTLSGGSLYGGIHYTIQVYCNNSTTAQDYTGPDGNNYTVAAGSFQVWSVNGTTSAKTRYFISGPTYDIPRSVETVSTTGDKSIPDNTPLNAFLIQGSANTGNVAYQIIDGGMNVSYVGTALPVSFIPSSFKGTVSGKSVLLNWSTASEQNNAYFEVLHSADGNTFSTIGKVAGNQTTSIQHNYSFTDNNPYSGINYYKLKEVDVDGQTTLNSNIVAISAQQQQNTFTVYRNGNQLNATVYAAKAGNADLQIFTIAGQQISDTKAQLMQGRNQLSVTLLPSLQSGVYIAVVNNNGNKESAKFIK